MDRVWLAVDFNEMVDRDVVMLSQKDEKADRQGNLVSLFPGKPVMVYEQNQYEDSLELLFAQGVVIPHDLQQYPLYPHVKWFCRLEETGIQVRQFKL